jgi:hypothetical protein
LFIIKFWAVGFLQFTPIYTQRKYCTPTFKISPTERERKIIHQKLINIIIPLNLTINRHSDSSNSTNINALCLKSSARGTRDSLFSEL